MNNKDIQKLAKLREHVINFYNRLEEKHSSTSMMSTKDSAFFCEQVISSIDDVIKTYVEFK